MSGASTRASAPRAAATRAGPTAAARRLPRRSRGTPGATPRGATNARHHAFAPAVHVVTCASACASGTAAVQTRTASALADARRSVPRHDARHSTASLCSLSSGGHRILGRRRPASSCHTVDFLGHRQPRGSRASPPRPRRQPPLVLAAPRRLREELHAAVPKVARE